MTAMRVFTNLSMWLLCKHLRREVEKLATYTAPRGVGRSWAYLRAITGVSLSGWC